MKEVFILQELKYLLLDYLQKIGITANFNLELKEYSKSLFGRYNPNTNTVILYVFDSPKCNQSYKMWDLLKTFIHEVCHCEQWNDPKFIRHKGVMHNTDFWSRYNKYIELATELLSTQQKEVVFINEKITFR